MKIICLSCGHKIDLGDAYDDYAGLVKCSTCAALLEIKTESGGLKWLDIGNLAERRAPSPSSEPRPQAELGLSSADPR